jgi:hypothetical protein
MVKVAACLNMFMYFHCLIFPLRSPLLYFLLWNESKLEDPKGNLSMAVFKDTIKVNLIFKWQIQALR